MATRLDLGENGQQEERAIAALHPLREVGREQGKETSMDYEFVDGQGDIGVIASVTEPFRLSCSRAASLQMGS